MRTGCGSLLRAGFVVFAATSGAVAQYVGNRSPEGGPPVLQPPQMLYFEAVNMEADVPGLSRVDILYRIDLSFFVGVRKEASQGFARNGEILVELADSTGTTRARETGKIHQTGKDGELRQGRVWHQGIMSFSVPPATYRILVTLEDLESSRRLQDTRKSVRALEFTPGMPSIPPPFFVLANDSSSASLMPQNFGGGVRLGARGSMVLPIANLRGAEDLSVRISVNRIRWQSDRGAQVFTDTTDDIGILHGVKLLPERSETAISYRIDTTGARHSFAVIPFPTERIPPYPCTLTLHARIGESDLKTTMDFEAVWPDIPRSLRDRGYAFQTMQYIVPEEELDSLRAGSDADAQARFEEFWAARDRTPGDAYNEVMNEYYTRVDYAAESFSTLGSPDGALTDRGRIYVLFGPPTRSERKLDPAGFLEIWTYEHLSRQYVFLDAAKTGRYVLTSTRPL
jgi:GWxTD domain-containing protein